MALVIALCVAGTWAYLHWRASGDQAAPTITTTGLGELPTPAPPLDSTSSPTVPGGAEARPFILFRSTAIGEAYGRVGLEYLDRKSTSRPVAPLACERVHFAAGSGVCLEAKRGVFTSYHAHLFDRNFQINHSFVLGGPPSRARMSPDGRLAAVTVFISGHSYSSPGFSTRTSILDVTAGKVLVDDLEQMTVLRDGVTFKGADFNFWGVTFAGQSDRFYATLGTGGRRYLVEGGVADKVLRVIHDNVECPSLSPKGRLIAFKRQAQTGGQGRPTWSIRVLDLASMKELPPNQETRDVDDQVEWLDDAEVVYALPDKPSTGSAVTNLWALRVDGSAPPRLLIPQAYSPAVVR